MIEDARQKRPQLLLHVPNPGAKPGSSTVVHGLRSQAGSMLLEAFIAILIFSLGILAIVGMWTMAIKNSADAKYRSDANLLANELIGQMWVSDRTPATLQNNFQGGAGTDGASYTAWYANVQAALPGSGTHPPTVSIDPVTSIVTIAVQWKLPSEPAAAAAHNYTVVAQIK